VTLRTDSFVPSAAELRRAFASKSPAELVFFARQCLERGGYDQVLALAAALGARFEEEPSLALTLAVARFLAGERAGATAAVAAVVEQRPEDLNALSVLAEMRARQGDGAGAVAALARLVELYPDYPGTHATLAALLMPGPSYRDVLRAIHAALRPRTYLELGVAAGATLSLATGAEIAVGVDPVEAPLEHVLPAGARVVRATSAAFFAEQRRADVFGSTPVELTFVDGLHEFETALDDFLSAEAWSSAASTIVLHDCVPIARVTARRERATRFWVGDTWKAAWALARYRPELRIRTVLTPPSGLVVVRRLDPSAAAERRDFARAKAELAPLEYPLGVGEWPAELHVVPNTPAGLAEALG
jgi:methyltransferase family protein